MESIERYRRSLKRKNYSSVTLKNYLNRIERFVLWLNAPLTDTTRDTIGAYVDHLLPSANLTHLLRVSDR
jgi:site-specific recombinase XerD